MKVLIVDDERAVDFAMRIAAERNQKFRIFLKSIMPKEVTLVKTFEEAKRIFLSDEKFSFLLMDHDLASTDVHDDGTRLMNILEERFVVEKVSNFKTIIAISSNPRGAATINLIAKRISEV